MVTSGRGLQQDPCPDTQLPLPPRSAPPPGAPNTRKQRPSDGESGPRQHWPGALSELSRMDRRPGIRPPSPQDPCRRHIHPSPRTPRRCPASGSRNLKPKRLGRTPGSAGGVASQGVDHLAGSGPAGVHLHWQSREPCLTWSDSGSSGGRLTGESLGEPGWWSGCTFLEGRPLPAQAHSHSPPQTSPAGSPPLLPRVSSVSSPPPPPTLWVKAQHEGALQPPCIVRKDPRRKRFYH